MTAVIRFIFSIVSCVVLLKMGRRSLGIVSALGTSLASLILAGYIIARKEESSVDVSISICYVSGFVYNESIRFNRTISGLRISRMFIILRRYEHHGPVDAPWTDGR